MDFEEYLWARKEKSLSKVIRQSFEKRKTWYGDICIFYNLLCCVLLLLYCVLLFVKDIIAPQHMLSSYSELLVPLHHQLILC